MAETHAVAHLRGLSRSDGGARRPRGACGRAPRRRGTPGPRQRCGCPQNPSQDGWRRAGRVRACVLRACMRACVPACVPACVRAWRMWWCGVRRCGGAAMRRAESDRAGGAPRGAVRAGWRWESRAVLRLGTLGACFGRPKPYRCLASPADFALAPIFRPAVRTPTACVSFAGWGRRGGGVWCVVWVSVVERSGCLVIPFIVPVSYKMDYDQGV